MHSVKSGSAKPVYGLLVISVESVVLIHVLTVAILLVVAWLPLPLVRSWCWAGSGWSLGGGSGSTIASGTGLDVLVRVNCLPASFWTLVAVVGADDTDNDLSVTCSNSGQPFASFVDAPVDAFSKVDVVSGTELEFGWASWWWSTGRGWSGTTLECVMVRVIAVEFTDILAVALLFIVAWTPLPLVSSCGRRSLSRWTVA